MRTFVNLFLILFLADGGFSLIDELVPLLTPLAPFTAFRNLLALLVIIMSAAVYLCLGVDRRLPKRLFLPQILFVFFIPLSTWIFPVSPECGSTVSLRRSHRSYSACSRYTIYGAMMAPAR